MSVAINCQFSTFNFYFWKQNSNFFGKLIFVFLSFSIGLDTLPYDLGLCNEHIKTQDAPIALEWCLYLRQVSWSDLVLAFGWNSQGTHLDFQLRD